MCDACDGRYTGVYPSMIPSFEDICSICFIHVLNGFYLSTLKLSLLCLFSFATVETKMLCL